MSFRFNFKSPKFGVVGLGLIGGSIAKSLKSAFPESYISGADMDADSVRKALEYGCIDGCTNVSDLRFDGYDAVFVCTPPHIAGKQIVEIDSHGVGVVTDTASVKMPVMRAASKASSFIGGHPMAGSEGSGFDASEENLFLSARYILCVPAGASGGGRVEFLTRVVESIGACPVFMDPEEHDRRAAIISHLPHAAAFGLSAYAARFGDPYLMSMAGGGYRDTTRIAASQPMLWSDIMMCSEYLCRALDGYMELLSDIRRAVASGDRDGLNRILTEASLYRNSLPEGLRAGKKSGKEGSPVRTGAAR